MNIKTWLKVWLKYQDCSYFVHNGLKKSKYEIPHSRCPRGRCRRLSRPPRPRDSCRRRPIVPAPVVIGDLEAGQPSPLVQIIINVNSASGSPAPAPAPADSAIVDEAADPIHVVDQVAEPVIVVDSPTVLEPVQVAEPVIVEPVIVGTPVVVEPVVIGVPIIPAPAVVLPEQLN
ncbi:hypothetical protein K1T71_010152 [Dendrolimus kikuchii]|uniref:Uncharacterized protein n=1 Tax=Dendrolimus kikuchii TaxID=765133 RepID=A0ACC1CR53_9NEOP|nr:hypothetical protein K1T71_010152 [Dendrolimus kikuchii]